MAEGSFFAGIDAVAAALHEAEPIALMRAAEHVRGISAELAPVESGHLAGSIEARLNEHEKAEIYVPGPYARYQHFGLDFRHEHGQALYLEQPMVTEAEKVQQIIAAALREAMP